MELKDAVNFSNSNFHSIGDCHFFFLLENHAPEVQEQIPYNKTRQGKGLFDWIGLGTGRNVDPYIAKTNKGCLNGDLAECFKSQALGYFSDFFDQPQYNLNDYVKVVRMSRDVVKEVSRQPYEYSGEARYP